MASYSMGLLALLFTTTPTAAQPAPPKGHDNVRAIGDVHSDKGTITMARHQAVSYSIPDAPGPGISQPPCQVQRNSARSGPRSGALQGGETTKGPPRA